MRDIIEKLVETYPYYVVEPFNKVYDEKSNFFELEDYYLENYLEVFAEKITFIVLRILASHNAYIQLTELAEDVKYSYPTLEDLSDLSYNDLSKIIKDCINCKASALDILFYEENILIYISSQFRVTVFGKNENLLKDIEELVTREGLFFTRHDSW